MKKIVREVGAVAVFRVAFAISSVLEVIAAVSEDQHSLVCQRMLSSFFFFWLRREQ